MQDWSARPLDEVYAAIFIDAIVLSARQHWDALKRDVKPIYTAPSEAAARAAFDELAEHWGKRYPAIIRLWDNAWEEFIPFLDSDTEMRRVIRSTNAIESSNARYRRAVKARGHFPSEQAALKCLYLATRSLDPTGKVGHDGSHGGNPLSVPSRSRSRTVGPDQKPTTGKRPKHR